MVMTEQKSTRYVYLFSDNRSETRLLFVGGILFSPYAVLLTRNMGS